MNKPPTLPQIQQPQGNHTTRRKRLINFLESAKFDILLGVIFFIITCLYVILMFTNNVPLPGLILLFMLWFVFSILSRRISFATPMDMLIIGLLLFPPISLFVSIDWELTLPNTYGLVLSAALFYLIVNLFRRRKRLPLALIATILLAIMIATLGLVGTDWGTSKSNFLTSIYQLLPNVLKNLPGMPVGQGINENTLGGALAFFLPFLVSLIWDKGGFRRMYLKNSSREDLIHILYKSTIGLVILLIAITLILTQSRGAMLGSIVGILVLAIWKDKHFLWVLPVILLYFIVIIQGYTKGGLTELVALLDNSGEATIQSRLTLWQNSIYILQDFPITGTGLSAFGSVFQSYYTFNIFPYANTVFFHAHNTFLTIAVEMGLPAMVLYGALLGSFFTMAFYVNRTGRKFIRTLASGLACGMIAHQVFGLTDAYTLGKKLGVIMWIYFGLMTALFIHRHRLFGKSFQRISSLQMRIKPDPQFVKHQFKNMLFGFLFWIVVSLAAIAFINLNPYISLAVAIAGGALLGVHLTHQYRETTKRLAHSQ